MNTWDEERIQNLKHQGSGRIPVAVGILPAVWMKYREALDDVLLRHPGLFPGHTRGTRNYDAVDGAYAVGNFVDEWGCGWSNVSAGHNAIVTKHPVPTRAAVHELKMPVKDAGLPHGLMWLRLADLRGFEELMFDFAEEPPELQMLIDIVLQYNLQQAQKHLAWIKEPEALVWFADDLGMQHGLAISPAKWRKYLKPCFARLFKPFRDAGHHIHLHTDGHILEIIPDLVECGMEVVNAQVGANGLDNLVAVCKGKVCVNLDLDRQMFPFWTPREIDAHVREVVEKLGSRAGGLWLNAEIAEDIPLANVDAILAALVKYRDYYV